MTLIVYRPRWLAGEVRLSDEHDRHAWWTLAEFTADAVPPRLIPAIRRALDG